MYLEEAIDSIERQSYTEWECIAIDDRSTDRSIDLLRAWDQRDTRVRVFQGDGKGIVAALNLAASYAKGAFFARMDADDICHPQRFAKQLAFFENNPNCVALGSRILWIDPKGRVLGGSDKQLQDEGIRRELRQGNGGAITHPSLMMPRLAFERVGGYRPEYRHVEDFDLYWRLSQIGSLANLPEVLLKYRQHFNSVNHQKHRRQIELKAKVLAEFERETSSVGLPQKKQNASLLAGDSYASWSHRAMLSGYFKLGTFYALRSYFVNPSSRQSFLRSLRLLRLGYRAKPARDRPNLTSQW
jgi:glycosyltransferase involved in cell wall biosynthesis